MREENQNNVAIRSYHKVMWYVSLTNANTSTRWHYRAIHCNFMAQSKPVPSKMIFTHYHWPLMCVFWHLCCECRLSYANLTAFQCCTSTALIINEWAFGPKGNLIISFNLACKKTEPAGRFVCSLSGKILAWNPFPKTRFSKLLKACKLKVKKQHSLPANCLRQVLHNYQIVIHLPKQYTATSTYNSPLTTDCF